MEVCVSRLIISGHNNQLQCTNQTCPLVAKKTCMSIKQTKATPDHTTVQQVEQTRTAQTMQHLLQLHARPLLLYS
jgi:hypothetical protein